MNGLSNALGRRELLDRVTKIGFIAAIALWFLGQISANAAEANPLKPPANGSIRLRFLFQKAQWLSTFAGLGKFFGMSWFLAARIIRSVFTLFLNRLLRSVPAAR